MTTEQLIAKLEREQFETSDPHHSVEALAYRKGHNDRAKSLIAELKVEAGLVELEQNAPVDTRLRDQMIKFDLGGES